MFRKKKCQNNRFINSIHPKCTIHIEKKAEENIQKKIATERNVAQLKDKQQEETQPQQTNVSSCKRKNYYLSF